MEHKLLEQKCPEVIEGALDTDKPTGKKSRMMVFTWFHDKPIEFDDTMMKYLFYGEETCPTTGKKHLQGYVVWLNPRSERAVCKEYKMRARCAKGSIADNDIYCSKDGKTFEFGTKPQQGKRTDLDDLKNMIVTNKKSVDDIVLEQPIMYHQYGRTLEKIEDIMNERKFRNWKTEVIWYVGDTGVGKSKLLWENYDPTTMYRWKNDNGWQDGYRGEPIVLIEEFRGNIPYSELLQMCDQYPYDVKRRGRRPHPFLAKKIIITSPLKPSQIYKELHKHDSLDQLKRRIKLYKIWTKGGEPELLDDEI